MYLKFSQIRPRTTELAALQRLKNNVATLGKLVANHLIHFKFVGFEDMQQILQLNMGLSAVERLKTHDAEKVVCTFLVSDVAKPASMDSEESTYTAPRHGQDVQIFTISTGIKSVRYRGKIAVFRHFP